MNIILLEKISNLGKIGDTAEVKAGFARNYLLPKGKAVPATAANLTRFEQRRGELLAAHDENVRKAEARKAVLEGMALHIEVNASDEGKLYGSVGTRDIAAAVNAKASEAALSKAEVLLPHGAIRQTGEYTISLDLGYEVGTQIELAVVRRGTPAEVTDDGSVLADIEAAEAAEAEAKAIAEAAAKAAEATEDSEPKKKTKGLFGFGKKK